MCVLGLSTVTTCTGRALSPGEMNLLDQATDGRGGRRDILRRVMNHPRRCGDTGCKTMERGEMKQQWRSKAVGGTALCGLLIAAVKRACSYLFIVVLPKRW